MLITNQRLLFQEEFKVLASADSVGALRKRLKLENLEKFGEPFTPEFVYDIIKKLPRFASMRVSFHCDLLLSTLLSINETNASYYSVDTSKTQRSSWAFCSSLFMKSVCML